jgi:hypothetical protein
MKQFTSLILIAIIIASLCTIPVFALPTSGGIESWVLSDSGNNTRVQIIQYPKITTLSSGSNHNEYKTIEMELHEIILKMDFAAAQKYLQGFKNSQPVPELVLYGTNAYDIPKCKITLENCTISGITVTDLFTGRSSTPVQAVVTINATQITTLKLSTAGDHVEAAPIKKLDTAKAFINDSEYTGYISFSGFEGVLRAYGSVEYGNSEMIMDYNEIGALPDWLSRFDGKTDYTSGANPNCILRYELSSTTSEDELSFEVQLNAIQQELTEPLGNDMLVKYTFKVSDFSFVTPPEANSDPAAPGVFVPVAPDSLIIRGSNLVKVQEYTWAGKWMTTFGDMALKQNERKVTGEYGNPIAILEGTALGNKLSGTWQDILSSGTFEFTMSDDGKSFSGTMYDQDLGERGTFEWNGDREQQ